MLAVCSDRKIVVPSAANALLFDYYLADLYAVQHYHPFGMQIPERSAEAEGVRFGFNGKEKDGVWGAQDYGIRMYQPLTCRFLSPDPLIVYGQNYAYLSSYQFASNRPINGIDLEGLEWSVCINENKNVNGGTTKKVTFTVNITVIDQTCNTDKSLLQTYMEQAKLQAESSFSGQFNEGDDIIKYKTNVNFIPFEGNDPMNHGLDPSTDFYMEIKDFPSSLDGVQGNTLSSEESPRDRRGRYRQNNRIIMRLLRSDKSQSFCTIEL